MKTIFYYYNSTGTLFLSYSDGNGGYTDHAYVYSNSAANTDCSASTFASSNFIKEVYTMAKIAELKKYLGYEFSSGSYTGEDYKSFQTKYINYLKAICRENHWQLVNVGRNHYCFSAFIKSAENKCVYISISDVRYFTNEWFSHILIRTAKDEQDYRGGFNHYTTLENLDSKAAELLEDLPF